MKTLFLCLSLWCSLFATSQVFTFKGSVYSNCIWNDTTEDFTDCKDIISQPLTKFEFDTLKRTLKWITSVSTVSYTIEYFDQDLYYGNYLVRNASGSYWLYQLIDENKEKDIRYLLIWSCDSEGRKFLVKHNSSVLRWFLWK